MEIAASIRSAQDSNVTELRIGSIIQKATIGSDVIKNVLIFLESAHICVSTMDLERRKILTEARICNIGDFRQVDELWQRLDKFFYQDNIRNDLVNSICGLNACLESIKKESMKEWWRRQNEETAVQEFSNRLKELDDVLWRLTFNFFPGGVGMGLQTLWPIYKLIGWVRDELKTTQIRKTRLQLKDEELRRLIVQALRDKSHDEWFLLNGKVEALIAELQLSFSLKMIENLKMS